MNNNFNKNNQQLSNTLQKDNQIKEVSGSKNTENKKIVWEENGIIMCGCVGGQGEQILKEFVGELLKLLNSTEGRGRVLINGKKGGVTISARLRKIYIEFGKKAKAEKIAIFGLNTLQRVVAAFIMKAIGKSNIKKIKFFSTKEEALKWLKEETEERELNI